MSLRTDNARHQESPWVWAALQLGALVAVLLFSWAAGRAIGEEAPKPPAVTIRTESWSMYLLKAGQDRRPVFGARAQLNAPGPLGSGLFARLDASAMPANGAPVAVSFADLSSAETIEGCVGGYRDLVGPMAVAAFAGTAVPLQGGTIVPGTRYPEIYGGGMLVGDGTGDRWILAAIGKHAAAGPGTKALVTFHYRLSGRTSAVGDAALGGEGSFSRLGLSVCLSGCEVKK